MAFTASTGQQAANTVQSGTRNYIVAGNVTASSPTGGVLAITGDSITLALINTGTLDNAASLRIEGSLNNANFYPIHINGTAKTWTGTQINAGVMETLNVKVNQIRLVLTPGTTTGTNGVQPRVLD